MQLSNKITPETLAAVTAILQQYCPGLSPAILVEAIKNHSAEKKPQGLQKSLTYKEFAALAGLSIPTVHRMARNGSLQVVKIGPRLVRIPYEAAARIILNGTQATEASDGKK